MEAPLGWVLELRHGHVNGHGHEQRSPALNPNRTERRPVQATRTSMDLVVVQKDADRRGQHDRAGSSKCTL